MPTGMSAAGLQRSCRRSSRPAERAMPTFGDWKLIRVNPCGRKQFGCDASVGGNEAMLVLYWVLSTRCSVSWYGGDSIRPRFAHLGVIGILVARQGKMKFAGGLGSRPDFGFFLGEEETQACNAPAILGNLFARKAGNL